MTEINNLMQASLSSGTGPARASLENCLIEERYSPDSITLAGIHQNLVCPNLVRNDHILTIFTPHNSFSNSIANLDFNDRSFLSFYNQSATTNQSRLEYFSGLSDFVGSDWTSYVSITRHLVISMLIYSRSQGTLDSLQGALKNCKNNSSQNLLPFFAVINLLGYSYPIFMGPDLTCAQAAGELLILSHTLVDVPLVDALRQEWYLSAYIRNLIFDSIYGTVNKYPVLTIALATGTTASTLALLGYPVGPPLMNFSYSWLVQPTLRGSRHIFHLLAPKSEPIYSNPSWFSFVLNYYANPHH